MSGHWALCRDEEEALLMMTMIVIMMVILMMFMIITVMVMMVMTRQGYIFCLTCSYPELTKDHVLTSAYVNIFRTVTRNAVNKSA